MKTSIDHAIKEICRKERVAEQELKMGVRTRKFSRVRAKIAYHLSHEFGISRAEIPGYWECVPQRLLKLFRT